MTDKLGVREGGVDLARIEELSKEELCVDGNASHVCNICNAILASREMLKLRLEPKGMGGEFDFSAVLGDIVDRIDMAPNDDPLPYVREHVVRHVERLAAWNASRAGLSARSGGGAEDAVLCSNCGLVIQKGYRDAELTWVHKHNNRYWCAEGGHAEPKAALSHPEGGATTDESCRHSPSGKHVRGQGANSPSRFVCQYCEVEITLPAPHPEASPANDKANEVARRIVSKFPQIEQLVLAPLLRREIAIAFAAFFEVAHPEPVVERGPEPFEREVKKAYPEAFLYTRTQSFSEAILSVQVFKSSTDRVEIGCVYNFNGWDEEKANRAAWQDAYSKLVAPRQGGGGGE